MRIKIRVLPILFSIFCSYFLSLYFVDYNTDSITFFYILSLILFSTLITQKYEKSYSESFTEFFNPFLKSYSILLLIFYLSNFVLEINPEIFHIFLLYVILEFTFVLIFYLINTLYQFDSIDYIKKSVNADINLKGEIDNSTASILKIIKSLDCSNLSISETKKKITKEIVNVEISSQPSKKSGLFIFEHKLNNQKNIGFTLSNIYESVNNYNICGFFYEDIEHRRKSLNYSFIDFVVHKILPFIPLLNMIYFNFLSHLNRPLSKAETWGRLHFAGFEVIDQLELSNSSIVFAIKKYKSSHNQTPSYYPIIRLERVGFKGKKILIHKVRTMYPYSEFIQKKVFEMSSLSGTGKFNDDFRITKMGHILRKSWLDEIPQIIDWLRGDIKIVGIRAMSLHYFSLYPSSYKKKYYSVKPGIFSPIFDEKTSSFEDIIRIEEEYLTRYLKNPIYTDLVYFFRALNDIILKGVRSN